MRVAWMTTRGILRAGHPGQAIVWTAVMLPLFLAIIGLAIDGGIAFNQRRALQNVADGAARAGAMQIDQAAYRGSAGQAIVLDDGSAAQVAEAYVASQGRDLTANVTADQRHVVVSVQRIAPTGFLRVVGIKAMRISATATAGVAYGIAQGTSP